MFALLDALTFPSSQNAFSRSRTEKLIAVCTSCVPLATGRVLFVICAWERDLLEGSDCCVYLFNSGASTRLI